MAIHRVLIALTLLFLLTPFSAAANGPLAADEVALVIQFDAERYVVRKVPLTFEIATGQDALLASGLDVVMQGYSGGGSVCQIAGYGCDYPAEPCFCAMPNWWHYEHWLDDAWQISGVGAAGWILAPDMVDGWSWSGGWEMVDIVPQSIFDANRLAPSVPMVAATDEGLAVRLEVLGDANRNAGVDCVLSLADGTMREVPMVLQTDGVYLGWVSGPLPGGLYECLLSYDDPDGVNGSNSWRETGRIDIEQRQRLYLPCAHKGE